MISYQHNVQYEEGVNISNFFVVLLIQRLIFVDSRLQGIHEHDMKKLEQAKMKNVYIDLASFVITVNEDYTTNREQKLNYPLLTLVSDIGGAA